MAYRCPKCKLLFSNLVECCPNCAGPVESDLRLDRYYMDEGFRRHTAPTASAVWAGKKTKTEPAKAPVSSASEPVGQPKVRDDDTLAQLRKAYYQQYGGSDTEDPLSPRPGASVTDPTYTTEPEPIKPAQNPESSVSAAKKETLPLSNNSGSFFDDPGPAPYVPEDREDRPRDPLPPVTHEPITRQENNRGTGFYDFFNMLAGVNWGCVFRVLLVLAVIGVIVAICINWQAIVGAILDFLISLLPAALFIGGIIYVLRMLFRGGR